MATTKSVADIWQAIVAQQSKPLIDRQEHAADRSGRCLCGAWVVDHFDALNRKLTCEQVARIGKAGQ